MKIKAIALFMSLSSLLAVAAFADCQSDAIADGWNPNHALLLCNGAGNSDAPWQCGDFALADKYKDSHAVMLCSGATSNQPVICADQAIASGADDLTAIHQCGSSLTL